MKLFTGLALAGILMAGTVDAQHAKHVNLGIKGGLNFYNTYNDNNVKYNTNTGIHLGLFWHIHMSENFALQPEIVYSTQGAKYSNNNDKLRLGYVNLPFMFQYMFNNGFRLQAGPQVGVLVHAHSEDDGRSVDIKSNLKPLELGVAAGVGYIMSNGFGFDARYIHGLSNINDNGSIRITNGGFQLGMFYQFSHK